MTLRVGSLVYATNQGLGILAKSFWDNGLLTDVFVIEHASHPSHHAEWYPGAPSTPIRNMDVAAIRAWASKLDVFLAVETPFDWGLYPHLQHKGIKTVELVMYECGHHHPPARPDRYICPSLLDLRYFPAEKSVFLPVPVDVPWRQRTEAKVFVHNAGNGSFRDRNGTQLLWDALPYVQSPCTIIFRSQKPLTYPVHQRFIIPKILQRWGTAEYKTLWDEGDAFVFCERWNGLSLPLQEARASGMLVIAGDRFPMNEWLPREGLVRVDSISKGRIGPPYNEMLEANYRPQDVAEMIDRWHGRDISAYSRSGAEWAKSMSWEVLGPLWKKELAR